MNNVVIIDNMLTKDAKNWSCPKKILARQEVQINLHREIFGHIIPRNKQYWTMSGQCADSNGSPIDNCELDQIVKAGLIAPNQFHGVEINPEIYNLNSQAWPESNWYLGDFYQVMDNADNEGIFNPSIVNADLITMPETSMDYLADIFDLLSSSADDVMFVINLVLRSKHKKSTIEDAIDKLNENKVFQSAIRSREWNYLDSYYSYAGTGKRANSNMSSMVFYLKGSL